jgi:hypothetical protein
MAVVRRHACERREAGYGSLIPRTRFVLTNAIYFKGVWETSFREELTKDREFHGAASGEGTRGQRPPATAMDPTAASLHPPSPSVIPLPSTLQ